MIYSSFSNFLITALSYQVSPLRGLFLITSEGAWRVYTSWNLELHARYEFT